MFHNALANPGGQRVLPNDRVDETDIDITKIGIWVDTVVTTGSSAYVRTRP